jgi:hypothetical protein
MIGLVLLTMGGTWLRGHQLEERRRVWAICTALFEEQYFADCQAWALEGVRLGADVEDAAADLLGGDDQEKVWRATGFSATAY